MDFFFFFNQLQVHEKSSLGGLVSLNGKTLKRQVTKSCHCPASWHKINGSSAACFKYPGAYFAPVMLVSVNYKLSLFNAHATILIFHTLENVNKLCINQQPLFVDFMGRKTPSLAKIEKLFRSKASAAAICPLMCLCCVLIYSAYRLCVRFCLLRRNSTLCHWHQSGFTL